MQKRKSQIGLIILKARKEAGLTQPELAQRTPTIRGYVSKLERGINIPSDDMLASIARALDADFEAWHTICKQDRQKRKRRET